MYICFYFIIQISHLTIISFLKKFHYNDHDLFYRTDCKCIWMYIHLFSSFYLLDKKHQLWLSYWNWIYFIIIIIKYKDSNLPLIVIGPTSSNHVELIAFMNEVVITFWILQSKISNCISSSSYADISPVLFFSLLNIYFVTVPFVIFKPNSYIVIV